LCSRRFKLCYFSQNYGTVKFCALLNELITIRPRSHQTK
jgi:hypothetical protein